MGWLLGDYEDAPPWLVETVMIRMQLEAEEAERRKDHGN